MEKCPIHPSFLNSAPTLCTRQDMPRLRHVELQSPAESLSGFAVGDAVNVFIEAEPIRAIVLEHHEGASKGRYRVQLDDGRAIDVSATQLERFPGSYATPRAHKLLCQSKVERASDRSMVTIFLQTPATLTEEKIRQMLERYNKLLELNVEQHERRARILSRRSTLHFALGNYQQALGDADQSLQACPLPIGWFRQGCAQYAIQDYAGSAESFRKVRHRARVWIHVHRACSWILPTSHFGMHWTVRLSVFVDPVKKEGIADSIVS